MIELETALREEKAAQARRRKNRRTQFPDTPTSGRFEGWDECYVCGKPTEGTHAMRDGPYCVHVPCMKLPRSERNKLILQQLQEAGVMSVNWDCYEYIILRRPAPSSTTDLEKPPEIIKETTLVIAKSEHNAQIVALQDLGKVDNPEELEVHVRAWAE